MAISKQAGDTVTVRWNSGSTTESSPAEVVFNRRLASCALTHKYGRIPSRTGGTVNGRSARLPPLEPHGAVLRSGPFLDCGVRRACSGARLIGLEGQFAVARTDQFAPSIPSYLSTDRA